MKVTLSSNNQNYSFKGYDVTRLKGFYMQGLVSPAEKRIFNEMAKIAKKEHLDLFINQNNTKISKKLSANITPDPKLSIWGQDRKAFVKQNGADTILENIKETVLCSSDFSPIGNYKIKSEKYIPRGGNYYIGCKDNGEKWAIVNSMEIYNQSAFEQFADKPTIELFCELLDIKPQNVFMVNEFSRDLDEVIRPIGYPYVLVNDFSENLKNIDKLEKKFPNSKELIARLRKHSSSSIISSNHSEILKQHGFKPINIGGFYDENINFINALAFVNKNNKISYITNSTKGSCPELEYLEHLFAEDLRTKVKNVENVHFVSGGTKENSKTNDDTFALKILSYGSQWDNAIMDILANRKGGIHCMTAEIPM